MHLNQGIGLLVFRHGPVVKPWNSRDYQEFEPNIRESTDLSTEESLLKALERNLSTARSASKKKIQPDQTSDNFILSKDVTVENNENDQDAEKEKCKKGMKKIEENNMKLDDLHEHIKNIRAETEEIRRENAKMFHIYKESFIPVLCFN